MTKILIFIILCIGATYFGYQFLGNSEGYVVLGIPHYGTVNISFQGAVLILIIAYLLLEIIRVILAKIFGFFEKKPQQKTSAGLLALLEGDYKKAELLIGKSAEKSSQPLLNYLSAAEASSALGNNSKRDHYLNLANKKFPKEKFAIQLERAKLLLQQNNPEEAITVLEQLLPQKKKHPLALDFYVKACLQTKQEHKLLKHLTVLNKQNIVTKDDLIQIEQQGLLQNLDQENYELTPKDWNNFWLKTNKTVRTSSFLTQVLQKAMHKNSHDGAFKIFSNFKKIENIDEDLARQLALLQPTDSDKYIALLESHYAQDPENSNIEQALASVYINTNKQEDAIKLLEKIVEKNPNLQASHQLIQLYKETGEVEKAQALYSLAFDHEVEKQKGLIVSS